MFALSISSFSHYLYTIYIVLEVVDEGLVKFWTAQKLGLDLHFHLVVLEILCEELVVVAEEGVDFINRDFLSRGYKDVTRGLV
jgi:hypothetical protein